MEELLNLRDIKFYTSTKNYKKIFFWGLYRIPAGFLKMAITTFAIIVSSNSNNNFDSIYLISVIYIFKFIEAGLGSFTPSFVRIGVRLKEKDPSNIKKNLISLYSYGFMISLSISLIFILVMILFYLYFLVTTLYLHQTFIRKFL